MNAIEFVRCFEEDGLRLFELLGFDTENRELRTTFNLLANTQRAHIAELLAMGKRVSGDTDFPVLERTKGLTNGFSRLLASSDIHREMKTDPDAFGHIVHAEEEFISMLEGIANNEADSTKHALLMQLLQGEKGHLEKIENIYDFIKTPHTYLEWGEFSNLHPL